MFARRIRLFYGNLVKPLMVALSSLGISPNFLSLLGLIAIIIAGLLFAIGNKGFGLAFLVFGSLLDTIDGNYARVIQKETKLGAFFDSICDHFGEFALYLGLLWGFLGDNQRIEVMLTFAALFGSVFGSHVRSRAGMIGVDLKNIGIFTRFERLLILILGIFFNKITIALWILALVNNFTAIQRIKKVLDSNPFV